MNHRNLKIILLLILLFIGFNFIIGQVGFTQKEHVSLVCVEKDGKYGFLDDMGKEVIPCDFDHPSSFSEGWAPLKKGRNWSYYDARGNKVLDLKNRFTYCGDFHDGVALVSERPLKNARYNSKTYWKNMSKELQFIDRDGKVLFKVANEWGINFKVIGREGFSDGLLQVSRERDPDSFELLYGYLDKSGRLQLPFEFRSESNASATFSEGFADLGLREEIVGFKKPVVRYGYIDKVGDWHIPPKYSKIYPFKHGVAMVSDTVPNSKSYTRYFLIDQDDNLIFPPDVETYPRKVRDSLVAVFKIERTENGGARTNTRRSAIAKVDGTLITDFIFGDLDPGKTAGDLWKASLPGNKSTVGFVNDKGEVIVPYQFVGTTLFEYGLAVVHVKEETLLRAVINVKGEFVMPPDSDATFQIIGGVITCNCSDGWGYYNRNGQQINLEGYTKCGPYQYLDLSDRRS